MAPGGKSKSLSRRRPGIPLQDEEGDAATATAPASSLTSHSPASARPTTTKASFVAWGKNLLRRRHRKHNKDKKKEEEHSPAAIFTPDDEDEDDSDIGFPHPVKTQPPPSTEDATHLPPLHEEGGEEEAPPSEEEQKQRRQQLQKVKAFLGVYTFLLVVGFGLSVWADLSRLVPQLLKLSLVLQITSSVFFCLVVPLTHFSGTFFFKKWRFFQPFKGGARFILFQTLSWTFYALCLVLAVSCLLFWSSVAKYTFGLLTSFGVFGVLSQVFMVTSLVVFERSRKQQKQQQRLQRQQQPPPPPPALKPLPMLIRPPPPPPSPTTIATETMEEPLPPNEKTDSKRHLVVGLLEGLYQDIFFHHHLALAVVGVALAILAEHLWFDPSFVGSHHRDFAGAAAGLSILLFTTVVFNTYGVGGQVTNGRKRHWRFWQPLVGGAKFVLLQALSWSLFTLSVVVEILFIISTFAVGFELFVGAAVVAGVFFLASEVLMIVSLRFYIPTSTGEEQRERKTSFMPVAVDEASLEQFRRLTVITILSNMQYLPFLLPILPFLGCGLSLTEATKHWFAAFCCLVVAVVVNAYVKTMVAKARRLSFIHRAIKHGLPLLAYSIPGICTYLNWQSDAAPAWGGLTVVHYLYLWLTFSSNPEVTGSRYLGEGLEFWPGGFSLYTFLEGVDQYFQAKLVWMDPELDLKSTPHVFAFHPHGVQPFTVFWIQLSKAWRTHMRGQRFCVMTASVMHYVPLMRDILQWLGGREVSKESILHALARRESVLLVPGGQQEMMESQSQMEEIRVVTKHVGFIRLALQNGVPLVPVLSFGEVEVMDFVRVPRLQRFFIERIGIPVPFFPYGLFGFPIPRPVPVTVVFGRPIQVERVAHPTPEQVKAVAKRYFQSIEEVFAANKAKAPGHENCRLVLL